MARWSVLYRDCRIPLERGGHVGSLKRITDIVVKGKQIDAIAPLEITQSA